MKNFNVTSMLVMLMFMCITSMQAQSITPSKKYITKELNNVSNFSSIRVLGSPDVEYRQSSDSKTTVSIYGSDNLVDLLVELVGNPYLCNSRFGSSLFQPAPGFLHAQNEE